MVGAFAEGTVYELANDPRGGFRWGGKAVSFVGSGPNEKAESALLFYIDYKIKQP